MGWGECDGKGEVWEMGRKSCGDGVQLYGNGYPENTSIKTFNTFPKFFHQVDLPTSNKFIVEK